MDTAGRPLVTLSAPGITSFNQLGADLAPGAYSGDEQGGTGTNFSDFTVKGNPARTAGHHRRQRANLARHRA